MSCTHARENSALARNPRSSIHHTKDLSLSSLLANARLSLTHAVDVGTTQLVPARACLDDVVAMFNTAVCGRHELVGLMAAADRLVEQNMMQFLE